MIEVSLALLAVNAASAFAQATPAPPQAAKQEARPTSDISNQKERGVAGTTYIRRTTEAAGPLTAPQFASTFNEVQLPANAEQKRIVLPTSDRQNRPHTATISALKAKAGSPEARRAAGKAYTNYLILRPAVAKPMLAGALPDGHSPRDIRELYGFPSDGGGNVIAIVDAFLYPQAQKDLALFSTTFGLPQCNVANGCLKILRAAAGNADTAKIPVNCGWALEAALDLQWAHAVAPKAKLIFVQAKSNSNDDLYAAVGVAIKAVVAAGGGQISMSWGSEESDTDPGLNATFVEGVLYFASSGDTGGELIYPAASPDVIAVGGTGFFRDSNGKFSPQYGWTGSGGGLSQYESMPAVQRGVEGITGEKRSIPDIAANADPQSGVAVYVSTPVATCQDKPTSEQYRAGWNVIGGTSLASPIVAAMTNASRKQRTSVKEELRAIYGNRHDSMRIFDVTQMTGAAGGNTTKTGYDNVTGVGTPNGPDFDAEPKP